MGTCGGGSIDYVLSDHNILPAEALRHYAERPLYLPFAYCYHPLEEPPAVTAPPGVGSGGVTFGSMNSLPKISRGALRAWRRILEQVPNGRLLIKAGFPFRDDEVRRRFLRRLEEEGIDPARVLLKDWVAGHAAHLTTYNEIDVALDSFPYNGVVTTYEALLMGVPVVTRTGARALDRYATSILRAVGLEDGIAADEDSYVARAAALAADRERLAMLRRTLRDRLLASPACDARLAARSIEQAFRGAWRDYCAAAH
jgi:predicted O-linked N-acetylglucosamine transferase (SPINDLY family)